MQLPELATQVFRALQFCSRVAPGRLHIVFISLVHLESQHSADLFDEFRVVFAAQFPLFTWHFLPPGRLERATMDERRLHFGSGILRAKRFEPKQRFEPKLLL